MLMYSEASPRALAATTTTGGDLIIIKNSLVQNVHASNWKKAELQSQEEYSGGDFENQSQLFTYIYIANLGYFNNIHSQSRHISSLMLMNSEASPTALTATATTGGDWIIQKHRFCRHMHGKKAEIKPVFFSKHQFNIFIHCSSFELSTTISLNYISL